MVNDFEQLRKEANYILEAQDCCHKPKKSAWIFRLIRNILVIMFLVLTIGTWIVFDDLLFFHINGWFIPCYLFTLIVATMGDLLLYEREPTPVEILFFNDYFIVYSPKKYFGKRETRKMFSIMNYDDVRKCVILPDAHRVQIYGKGRSVWYVYRKDGTLPDVPKKDRTWTNGMVYFSTFFEPDRDFKTEIEQHSPLTVTIEYENQPEPPDA